MMGQHGWTQHMGRGFLIGLLLAGCASGSQPPTPTSNVPAPKRLILTSPAFATDGVIPTKFTCDGENISPPLKWEPPPPGTQGLSLIVEDPDAPNKTFTHWVVYDLPANVRQLPEKLIPQPFLQGGGMQGKSSFGQYGYGGPCPPSGTHRYVFKLYALDQVMDLPAGTNRSDLIKAMQGHILAEGILTGKYTRQ
ncbi:MAG: YbhB/YbcL family Raf kinase inhibitor-like protein [Leptolyngbyaceae cyanobacterium CRU_2_3]|nr:YbhB/YbcL family Raf kinase inhibitor-like protein [Leptolyngbyaceae cyanobacterium CRU_2_3]